MTGSLFWRNLAFTILQPGLVACLFPYLLEREKINLFFENPFHIWQYSGLVIFIAGWGIVIYCVYRFAIEGKGTLSPADPTKNLVIKGLYRYSRNPMYIGVVLALAGISLFATSLMLGIYSLLIFIIFDLFIRFVEEPRLERDFKAPYVNYKKEVRRWL